MSARHWSAEFVGLPFRLHGRARDGVDCWGLVCLVYSRVGIELPLYAGLYAGPEEIARVAGVVADAIDTGMWGSVERSKARERDVMVFRRAGLETHVGVVCGGGLMLHIASGHESRIERVDACRWGPRLAAIYRHEALR